MFNAPIQDWLQSVDDTLSRVYGTSSAAFVAAKMTSADELLAYANGDTALDFALSVLKRAIQENERA